MLPFHVQIKTSFGACLVLAEVAIMHNPIVNRLFVNFEVSPLCRLVITLMTFKSHSFVFVECMNAQRTFRRGDVVTPFTLENFPFVFSLYMILHLLHKLCFIIAIVTFQFMCVLFVSYQVFLLSCLEITLSTQMMRVLMPVEISTIRGFVVTHVTNN